MMTLIKKVLDKVINGIKKVFGVKEVIVETTEKVVEVKKNVEKAIEIVEEIKEAPVNALSTLIPNFKVKALLILVLIIGAMYIVGLLAAVSANFAWPIIGILISVVVGLSYEAMSERDNENKGGF